MEIKFINLCRICLRKEGVMVSIFNPPPNYLYEVPITNRLFECCQIQVLQGDGLPEQICLECLNNVNIAYELRILSASSDAKLRQYLSFNIVSQEETITNTCEENSSPPKILPTNKTKVKNKKLSQSNKRKDISVDESTGKAYPCSDCGKSFAFQSLLREHRVYHTGDRPYLCSVCGKDFSHHATLSNHMKTHSDTKPHQCDICEQSFIRRSHLVSHRRKHTGEKPFTCDQCTKSFAEASYLKEHMRLHSGEKPFVCEVCGHRFARRTSLIMHSRVHTRELPFACPDCNLSFSQRGQRKRHVKKNHKDSKALGPNGHLYLREHDRVRQMLSKIKPDEHIALDAAPPSSSQEYYILPLGSS